MELEIWSDIACPWCYVGKRRIERALAEFEHADQVRVRWRSFELDPAAPAENNDRSLGSFAAHIGVTVEEARQMNARMTEVASSEGLDYHLEDQRFGSTFDAHRVVHLAAERGLQDQMKERLFAAQFIDGLLVSDPQVLTECAVEVGLDVDEVRELLATDRLGDAVREDEATARALGISGVPMFVVDREIGASGAQPPELLVSLLREGWERRAATEVAQ